MKFGEIWREQIDQNLFRYIVIVSPESLNTQLEQIIVVPIVSRFKNWPTRLAVKFHNRSRQIQGESVLTIPKSNLVEKLAELSLIEKAKLRLFLKQLFLEL